MTGTPHPRLDNRTGLLLPWRLLGLRARANFRGGWLCLAALAATVALLIVVIRQPAAGLVVRAGCALLFCASLAVALSALAVWWTRRAPVARLLPRLLLPVVLGVLILCVEVALLTALLFAARDVMPLLALLAMGAVVAVVAALPVLRQFAALLTDMDEEASRMAAGEYSARLDEQAPGAPGELSRLAHSVNTLASGTMDARAGQRAAEAERSQVITALSHDLRTPLSSILLMAEAIADGVVSSPEAVRRYHQVMRAEAGSLAALIDDLFELAQLESGSLSLDCEAQRLEEAVSGVVTDLQEKAAQARVRLDCQTLGPLPDVHFDCEQLSRAFDRLVRHAMSHTPAEGAVLVRLLPASAANGTHTVRVQVIDTGEGIAAEALPHIFSATYRAEPSRTRQTPPTGQPQVAADAGLGLAIAAHIVEAHGGSIWAESPLPDDIRDVIAPYMVGTVSFMHSPGMMVTASLPATA